MTVIGLGFGTTAMLRGKGFLRRAHGYMEQYVDRLEEFIDEAGLEDFKVSVPRRRASCTGSPLTRRSP